MIRRAEYDGEDHVLHAGNDLEVAPRLWVTTGVSAIKTKRYTEVVYPVTNEPYSRSTTALAPRADGRDRDDRQQVVGEGTAQRVPDGLLDAVAVHGGSTVTGSHAIDVRDARGSKWTFGVLGRPLVGDVPLVLADVSALLESRAGLTLEQVVVAATGPTSFAESE